MAHQQTQAAQLAHAHTPVASHVKSMPPSSHTRTSVHTHTSSQRPFAQLDSNAETVHQSSPQKVVCVADQADGVSAAIRLDRIVSRAHDTAVCEPSVSEHHTYTQSDDRPPAALRQTHTHSESAHPEVTKKCRQSHAYAPESTDFCGIETTSKSYTHRTPKCGRPPTSKRHTHTPCKSDTYRHTHTHTHDEKDARDLTTMMTEQMRRADMTHTQAHAVDAEPNHQSPLVQLNCAQSPVNNAYTPPHTLAERDTLIKPESVNYSRRTNHQCMPTTHTRTHTNTRTPSRTPKRVTESCNPPPAHTPVTPSFCGSSSHQSNSRYTHTHTHSHTHSVCSKEQSVCTDSARRSALYGSGGGEMSTGAQSVCSEGEKNKSHFFPPPPPPTYDNTNRGNPGNAAGMD